jgi:hypothetical protein
MEQTEPNDLFETKLNAEGKLYIRKFASVVEAVIILGILLSAINIVIEVIRAVKVNLSIFSQDKLLLWEYRIYPFYMFASITLFVLQLYYYRKLSRHMEKGIQYSNDVLFNRSFYFLYRYAMIGLVGFILAIIMNSLDLYWHIHHYL